MQTANINQTITRLKKELALNEKVKALLPECLKNQVLIVDCELYGTTAALLFKGSKTKLSDLLSIFTPVMSEKWKGVYDYTIPSTYDILQEKDSRAVKQGVRDATTTISCSNFKLQFYATLEDNLFCINLDFMDVIIGNNYGTLATGRKLPHLKENQRYTKNGRNGTKYLGVNGAGDTNHYEIKQAVSFSRAIEILE